MANNVILTRAEVAKEFKVSERTIKSDQDKGLPYIRVGKYPRYNYDEVHEFYKNKEENK